MKRSRNRLFIGLLIGLLIIQFSGYFLFAESVLLKHYLMDAETVEHHGAVGVLVAGNTQEVDERTMKEELSKKYSEVYITKDEEVWQHYWDNDSILARSMGISYPSLFITQIVEGNGSYGYGEVWEARKVWVLFFWIDLGRESIGQS